MNKNDFIALITSCQTTLTSLYKPARMTAHQRYIKPKNQNLSLANTALS